MINGESRQQRRARERAVAKRGTIGVEKISRGDYEWPRTTVIHPEHGSCQMDIHGFQAADGHIVLMAFLGKDETVQVDYIDRASRDLQLPIVPLVEQDISEDVLSWFAAQFWSKPDTHVLVMEVQRP